AHHVMAGMAHVDAKKICARLVQLLDHLLFGGGRTQRSEDLHFAVALHQFWPSCVLGASESCTIQLRWRPVSYSLKPMRWWPRAKQSSTSTILNSFSAVHMLTSPVQRPPRAASSA